MFNSLTGEITYKDGERVFLGVGQVEWELWTTAQTAGVLPPPGGQVRLFTYLHHRQDVLRLYGFATPDERELFLELIRVEGVGPRLALKILSGISAERFTVAVEKEDLVTLGAIPGLGQKTAQKIILRLKGRLAGTLTRSTSPHDDILMALTGMGFDRKEAKAAIEGALKEIDPGAFDGQDFERELLTRAMRLLGER